MLYVIIFIIVLLVAYKSGVFSKKSKTEPSMPQRIDGKYTGSIVLPKHEERIRAYEESRARGETNEGGGVDHGFYLEGGFALNVDLNGDMEGEFVIHGQISKATGKVEPSGKFTGTHEGGPFEGIVVLDKITGMIFEGGGREYLEVTQPKELKIPFIFGILNGTVQ